MSHTWNNFYYQTANIIYKSKFQSPNDFANFLMHFGNWVWKMDLQRKNFGKLGANVLRYLEEMYLEPSRTSTWSFLRK